MKSTNKSKVEGNNKRKGILTTIGWHAAIVAFALIPFMSMNSMDEDKKEEQVSEIVIDFRANEASTVKSSKPKASQAPPKTNPKPAETKPKPKPTPKPTPKPKPKPKPIVTVPKPDVAPVPKSTEVAEKPDPAPEKPAEVAKPEPIKGASFPSETTPAAEKPSEGTQGKGEAPGASTDGEDAEDYDGEGIFGRKVIFRPDIKDMTQKNGRIVVKICVNREGRVMNATYTQRGSTITDSELVQLAERSAKKYKFNKDYTAPNKQCGKITFIFKLH